MSLGKIKEFDMSTGNWTLYCERVGMYFCANAIKDELKLPTLISLVGDEIYELMVNLASPKKPSELGYNNVIELVRNHLQPKPSAMAERYKFRQRRQEGGETIMQYLAALKKLAKDCEFGGALDENLRDQFVCGVGSDLIRQRLFSETELTYAKAMNLATALEAAERDAAAVDASTASGSRAAAVQTSAVHALHVASPGKPRDRPRRGGGGAPPASRSNHVRCEACGAQHQTEGCRYANFVCNSCRNKGHLKKVCPYRDGARQPRPNSGYGGDSRTHKAHFVQPASAERAGAAHGGNSTASEEEVEPLFQMVLGDYTPT